jgi:Fic-DOC domain mobile mystery protein B
MMAFPTIPGETPLDDISGLKIKDITTRSQLEVAESENIRVAMLRYLGRKPSRRMARFDLSWVLKLHKEMFGQVWSWAGKIRKCNVNMGSAWQHVETHLYELLENLRFWEKNVVVLTQAVRLHHGAVVIHPFLNGNGRWSRMLANIWLKLHGQPITDWPHPHLAKMSPIRKVYLKALRQADEGDWEPLLQLHKKYEKKKQVD